MQAEIITIGDEILIGQTVDTNSAWLGQELSLRGIPIFRITSISDNKFEILKAVDDALIRSEFVIVTGGLGPTKDDITKHTLCEYFETKLVVNQEVLDRVTEFFEKRGREMLEVNSLQASLPETCEVIHNYQGTASGMWFEKKGHFLVSLPGVPYEMKGLMITGVFPKLETVFPVSNIYHQTLLTQGLGESFLAEKISDWENRVRNEGFGLAYLPSPSSVKLRITSNKGQIDQPKIEAYFLEIEKELPENTFGREKDTLSSVIGKKLIENKATLGTIESCTSGALAKTIVSNPGASAYFLGSIVTYSNALKQKFVNVPLDVLNEFGAVSEETVTIMASEGKKTLGVDYCIATSGITGPDGGSEDKPVGTIWIAIAHPSGIYTKKCLFGDHRDRNVDMTVSTALNMLRMRIIENS